MFDQTKNNPHIQNRISSPLCCVATILICLLSVSCFAIGYELDKTYLYNLEGSVLARLLNEDVPQYAGVVIKTKLAFKKTSDDELVLKLHNAQFGQVNNLIKDIDNHKQFSYKQFDASANLEKPFRVYIEDKSIKAFDTFKDEQKWVSNLKRGILSFFQIKLSAPGSQESDFSEGSFFTVGEKSVFGECDTDYVVLNSFGQSTGDSSQEASGYINVTKSRNMAKCKTKFAYKFMPIDTNECVDNDKDLQQFKHSSAVFNYNLIGSKTKYIIESASLDEQTVHSTFGRNAYSPSIGTKFSLNLLDDQQQDKVDMSVDTGSATRVDNLAYDPPELLNFYANVNLEDEHHLANIYSFSASVDQVASLMNELVAEQQKYTKTLEAEGNDKVSEQQPLRIGEYFMNLAELTGTLNAAKLEQLYSKIGELGNDAASQKKVFFDLMSVIGTNPSFAFMKKLIVDGDASSSKIKDYLTKLSFHIKAPSKALYDEYINLCKSDKIQTDQTFKRLCTLPLASLIHQHCVKPHAKYLRAQQESVNATSFKKGQNLCQVATAEEYFSRLVTVPSGLSLSSESGSSLSSGSSSSSSSSSQSSGSSSSSSSSSPGSSDSSSDSVSLGDKLLNIKLAGEIAIRPTIDLLADVVRRRDEHPSIRAASMWNLNKVARVYPNLVKKIAVPYYYDAKENLELRIAAFYSWLSAGLSLPELETLATRLVDEPNRQLVLYISSFLQSASEGVKQLPCNSQLDKHAKFVEPLLRKAVQKHGVGSLSDSRASLSGSFIPDFGYGSARLTSFILSNESFTPSNFYLKTAEIMSGVKLQPMTVSVQAHGLDKLLKRVMGINGLLSDKASFMDVFSLKRRAKRQATNEQLIKQEVADIEKELKLSVRDYSDVFLAVTVSAYGRPVMFMTQESRELKKMLSEDGTVKIPQIKKLLHSFNNYINQHMTINLERLELSNNELGLPILNAINDFAFNSFKLNSIKFDIEPGFFRDDRQGKPPTRIVASVDARTSKENGLFASLSTMLMNTKQKLGVGFVKKKLVNAPIQFNLDVNLVSNNVSLKRPSVHENILYIKQYPVTFVKQIDSSETEKSGLTVPEWLPLYNLSDSKTMTPFKSEYMTALALGVRAQGKHRAGADWSVGSWMRYLSSSSLNEAMFMYKYSPLASPLEVSVSSATTNSDSNPIKDLTFAGSWKHSSYDSYSSSNAAATSDEVTRELEAEGLKLGQKPSNVAYSLSVSGGVEKERKVGVELHYSRSSLINKWRVFYQRTPFDTKSNNKAEVTNLCWLGSAKFPRYNIDKLLKFDILDADNSLNMTSDISFGDECSGAKHDSASSRISAKATFDWSHHQREHIEKAFKLAEQTTEENNTDDQSEIGKLYKKCLAARKSGKSRAIVDQSCLTALKKMTELRHVTAHFDYKDVPERWVKIGTRLASLYTYARAGYIDEYDDADASAYGASSSSGSRRHPEYKASEGKPDNHAHLEANLSCNAAADSHSHQQRISYEFENPNVRVKYLNVPFKLPPPSTFPLFGSNYYKTIQRREENRICSVEGEIVTTFDNLTFTLPAIGDGCLKLLAKDCSPEKNFIVLGAKVGSGKLVKVYVAKKYKIEFIPDKEGKAVGEVKINGDTVPSDELLGSSANKQPVTRPIKLGQADQTDAFSIDFNGSFYTLSSKLYKFSVSTDGTWIMIHQSKYYAGKSCGICGDANGEQQLEFKSPSSSRKVCKNSTDFAWSYVLPSTCASKPTSIECNA